MGQKHHGLDERQDHRGACDLHMDNCEDLAKGVLVEDRDLPGCQEAEAKKVRASGKKNLLEQDSSDDTSGSIKEEINSALQKSVARAFSNS